MPTQYNKYTYDNNTHKTTTIQTANQLSTITQKKLKTSNKTHEANQNTKRTEGKNTQAESNIQARGIYFPM